MIRKIILALLLITVSASAESIQLKHESYTGDMQTTYFNVSFNLNKTHEIKINDVIAGFEIKTFDGGISISLSPDVENKSIDIFSGLPWQDVQIDGKTGQVVTMKEGKYMILYHPVPGFEATIGSDVPIYDSMDLIQSLHIEKVAAPSKT